MWRLTSRLLLVRPSDFRVTFLSNGIQVTIIVLSSHYVWGICYLGINVWALSPITRVIGTAPL